MLEISAEAPLPEPVTRRGDVAAIGAIFRGGESGPAMTGTPDSANALVAWMPSTCAG